MGLLSDLGPSVGPAAKVLSIIQFRLYLLTLMSEIDSCMGFSITVYDLLMLDSQELGQLN